MMCSPLHTELVIRYTKPNRYSFAALVGAIEENTSTAQFPVHIAGRHEMIKPLISSILARGNTPVIAFSLFSTQRGSVLEEIHKTRAEFPDRLVIVAGGPHPTAKPHDMLHEGVDYVVRGEGEATLPLLLAALDDDSNDLQKIPGLSFKTPDGCRDTPPGSSLDLNAYPLFASKHALFAPFEISRGCPHACKYCQVSHLCGTRMRHRSVAVVVAAAQLAARMRYRRIWLASPNAFAYGSLDGVTPNPNQVQSLLESLAAIPRLSQIYFGTFPSEVRPDSVTPEMLSLVKQYATNRNLVVGAQSGSDRILKAVRRGHTVEDIKIASAMIAESGLTADFDFIFGLPGENNEDQEATRRLLQEITAEGHRIHAHTFLPLPGTDYETEPPGAVDPETRRLLGGLVRAGRAYGSWEHQVSLARRLKGERVDHSWEPH